MVPVTCDTSLKFVYDSALGGGSSLQNESLGNRVTGTKSSP